MSGASRCVIMNYTPAKIHWKSTGTLNKTQYDKAKENELKEEQQEEKKKKEKTDRCR